MHLPADGHPAVLRQRDKKVPFATVQRVVAAPARRDIYRLSGDDYVEPAGGVRPICGMRGAYRVRVIGWPRWTSRGWPYYVSAYAGQWFMRWWRSDENGQLPLPRQHAGKGKNFHRAIMGVDGALRGISDYAGRWPALVGGTWLQLSPNERVTYQGPTRMQSSRPTPQAGFEMLSSM